MKSKEDNIEKIRENNNIFGDNIGFIEEYDFSRANVNEESRIKAITTVASICYANPKGVGSISLYNKLANESIGLPSSSYEFVPILFEIKILKDKYSDFEDFAIFKYGEKVENGKYLLTNYRAVVLDYEESVNNCINLRGHYNTSEEEIAIIKKHFKVYKAKIDISTSKQYIRHRVNWQELSRRYVSGNKVPFEFYVSDKMKNVSSFKERNRSPYSTNDVIEVCLNHYSQAIKDGVKPQEARRIIPQCAYTEIWSAWQPKQLDNFLKLRTKTNAQWEITQLALQKQEWLNLNKG